MSHRTKLTPIELPGDIFNGDLLAGNAEQQRFDQLALGTLGYILRATQDWVEWAHPRTALAIQHTMVFVVPGTVAEGTRASIVIPAYGNGNIVKVRTTCDVAASSGTYIFDLNKNGTTVYTTQDNRPQRVAGDGAGLVTHTLPDIVAFVDGDLFVVDVDAIGADLTRLGMFVTVEETP
jgi:hypothetical protein